MADTDTEDQGLASCACRPGTLLLEAYDHLKLDVITHRLKPGQKVSEARLTEHCQRSRASVRAAMVRLTQEGLMVQTSPKTTIIAPLTLRGISEVAHLRLLLEPDAARAAALTMDAAQLEALNAACDPALSPGLEDEDYLLANRAFHMAIAEAAGRPLQAQWIGRLQDHAMRHLWLNIQSKDEQGWAQGHRDIIAAIAARDPEAAARCAENHLRAGQTATLARLAESEGLAEEGLHRPA